MTKKEDTKDIESPTQDSKVTVHLDRDPNDPRRWPIIDGASNPKIDINEPIDGTEELA